MNAQDDILSAIRERGVRSTPRPARRHASPPSQELAALFAERAGAAAAQIMHVASREIPACVATILRSRNMAAILHLPPDPALEQMSWNEVPGLTLAREAPGPDDAALSFAAFAIAETGTLVYPASRARPASWHFRPGLEIAVLDAHSILFDLEQVLACIGKSGALPSTLNLVTGPSRTGDIEQTLELGAHGPKELVILVVPFDPGGATGRDPEETNQARGFSGV